MHRRNQGSQKQNPPFEYSVEIGFDVISDLHLLRGDVFDWEGKATSLYCVVAGNISNDLRMIHQVLWHLAKFYQGVFYIGGTLEYSGITNLSGRTHDLEKISKNIRNVAYLHHHVVIIDGVAILGATGWYENSELMESEADCMYLSRSIEKLQLHQDVKKIIVVTNAVPTFDLFFGESPDIDFPMSICLVKDSEQKITHWAYGSHDKNADITIDRVNYVNNSAYGTSPYWPKRISITI